MNGLIQAGKISYKGEEHVHGIGFSDKLAVVGCAVVQEHEIVCCDMKE